MFTIETKVYFAILIASAILGVILIFFISTIIRHQRKSGKLYQQQIKTEIITLEKERNRVATDMHDDLGPLLSAIKLQLDCLNSEDPDDLMIISKATRYIDEVFNKVRETSNNLMPRILIRKGLVLAIEDFAHTINETSALTLHANIEGDIKIDPAREIHLYRIVQEAINNAIKHAQAQNFSIHIRVISSSLVVEMSDDGRGFNLEKIIKEASGLGLKNILNRVEILNGEMYLESILGKGTNYTINIPIIV